MNLKCSLGSIFSQRIRILISLITMRYLIFHKSAFQNTYQINKFEKRSLMLSHFIVFGIISILSLHMFSKIYDFEITDANLVYFKNVTRAVPFSSNDTLTDSLKLRSEQIFGKTDIIVIDELSSKPSFYKTFYKQYFEQYSNKISKNSLFLQKDNNLNALSVNLVTDNLTTITEIGYYALREPRLFGDIDYMSPHYWRFCFHHRLQGISDAYAINVQKEQLVFAFQNASSRERIIRIYENLACDYSEGMDLSDFMLDYCQKSNIERNNDSLCENLTIAYKNENITTIPEIPSSRYHDIYLGKKDIIDVIAVFDRVIAFTTLDDPGRVQFQYRDMSGNWEKILSKRRIDFFNYQIHQTVGLQFLATTEENEIQLLQFHIYGSPNRLYLGIFYITLIHGSKLINNTRLYEPYGVSDLEEISEDSFFVSETIRLYSYNLTSELLGFDITEPHIFPKADIKYNQKYGLVLVVALQKYVYLLQFAEDQESGSFVLPFKTTSFLGQNFKIKKGYIADNGKFVAFLTYNQDRSRVYLMEVLDITLSDFYNEDPQLYLVNFDKPEFGTITDLLIYTDQNEDSYLILSYTTGELASYSWQEGSGLFVDTFDIVFGDEVVFISFMSIFMMILFGILIKFISSMRVNIPVRRQISLIQYIYY